MINKSKTIFELEDSLKLSSSASLFAVDLQNLRCEDNGKVIWGMKHIRLIAYTIIGRTKGGIIFYMYLDTNDNILLMSCRAPDCTLESINLIGEIIYLDSFYSYKLRNIMN